MGAISVSDGRGGQPTDLMDPETFEAVARSGGIARAARALHTVQSSVTARRLRLEREPGHPLSRRHSRGVTLTDAGRGLLPYAVKLRAPLDEARRAVSGDGEPTGALQVGSLETTASLRLPPILKDLVFRAGCSYRQRLERLLAERSIAIARRLEFGTPEGIIGCVGAGLGVTLLPRAVAEPARREGRVGVHRLPAGLGRAETVFIRRQDALITRAPASFLECCRARRSPAGAGSVRRG